METSQQQITESRLQQECFLWHWNTYPEDRGALYLHYNNPKNAIHGAILKGMGLVEGDMGRMFSKNRVYAGVIENYLRITPGQKALSFSASIESSQELTSRMQEAGINARHLDHGL